MTSITITLPESVLAYVQARANENAKGNVSAYLEAMISAEQLARERQEIEAKLLVGIEQLNRGEGEEMTEEEWESLINS
jgi:hypothetical protein